MMHAFKNIFLFIYIALVATSCSATRNAEKPPKLVSMNIIDRNGLNETITNKERLAQYDQTDFLRHQPYQKVRTTYAKDCQGNATAYLYSYYENGQAKQYLEIVNNRAYGRYQEWYENGSFKLEAKVIGGPADLSECAEKEWLFDGCAKAWDENGNLLTEIQYEMGQLEGDSLYYHPNGNIWKRISFHINQPNGTSEYYLDNGQLLQTISFSNGMRHGTALRFWSPECIAADEHYSNNLLLHARYYDSQGGLVAEISDGEGFRASFSKTSVLEIQEFHDGVLKGEVRVFNENGLVTQIYHIENSLKHGEEFEFQFRKGLKEAKPSLLISWYKGKIQGPVKTWYENGNIESQREMVNNKRNGISSAWYQDGSIMLIEEYDNDKLVRGEYYKKGERIPVSEVTNGSGIVTLSDGEGHFMRRINYYNGKPQE